MSLTYSLRQVVCRSARLRLRSAIIPSSRHFAAATDSNATEKPAAEANDSEEIATLKKTVEAQKEEIADLQDKYKRSLAETQNVRSRMQRQIEEAKVFGIQNFCKDLLEVADILQLATGSKKSEENLTAAQQAEYLSSMQKGLEMTQLQLMKVFQRHGLVKIDPLGEKFNPNCHEAVFEVPDADKTPGTVAVVNKIGYQLNQRVIRPAVVGVAKKP